VGVCVRVCVGMSVCMCVNGYVSVGAGAVSRVAGLGLRGWGLGFRV
jgi:hypothetical protein